MFAGAFFFWVAGKFMKDEKTSGHKVVIKNQETICAGAIAGGAIVGILIILAEASA